MDGFDNYQQQQQQQQQQQYFAQEYQEETNTSVAYPQTTMASFDFNVAAMAYSYCDQPALYANTLADQKYQMARSPSDNSNVPSYFDVPPALLPSGSVGSTSSSTVGSPSSGYAHVFNVQEGYQVSASSPYDHPMIACDDGYFTGDLSFPEREPKASSSCVDPGLISSPHDTYHQFTNSTAFSYPLQHSLSVSSAPSPAPSHGSYHTFNHIVTQENHHQSQAMQRRGSISSQRSSNSPRGSVMSDEDNIEKGRCPHPDCGKTPKDFKAHMLTHESVRPERCPIVTCPYHRKGFARKYDRNRHTLTHYKGTMICGFCPGSGSPAEKSFNRADVFKRHLTALHGVEQNPPNSRKRSPGSSTKKLSSYCQDATGKCSTCSAIFNNAQDFYEHLDECVLLVVQKEDPADFINAKRLTDINEDPLLQESFDRNMIKTEDRLLNTAEQTSYNSEGEEDEDDEEEEDDEDNEDSTTGRAGIKPKRGVINGGISKNLKPNRKGGMTWSRGGVAVGKGRKRRKNYPPSWGMSAEKMKHKKRVLCVYDGSRRLLKDDMMLDNEFEVRMNIGNGGAYVTDLDVVTLERAWAYHNATEEEKGVLNSDTGFLEEFM